MGKKLSFNDGMEKLILQKRQNDPAWALKELELQVRNRTLDNTYTTKANALLDSNNKDFKDGFILAIYYSDAMVKAGKQMLGNNPDISKLEGNYRSFSGYLNQLKDGASDDFNAGFSAGIDYIGSYVVERLNIFGEYYTEEEFNRCNKIEKEDPSMARIFSDVWNIGLQ